MIKTAGNVANMHNQLKVQANVVYQKLSGNRPAELMAGTCALIAFSIIEEVVPEGFATFGQIYKWDGNPDSPAYAWKHWWVQVDDGLVLDPMADALGATARRILPLPPDVMTFRRLTERLVREAGSGEKAVSTMIVAAAMSRSGHPPVMRLV